VPCIGHWQPLLSTAASVAAELAAPAAETAFVEAGGGWTVLVTNILSSCSGAGFRPGHCGCHPPPPAMAVTAESAVYRRCVNLGSDKSSGYILKEALKSQKRLGIAAVFNGQHFYKASASISLWWKGREFIFFVGFVAPSCTMAGAILNCRKLLGFFNHLELFVLVL